MKIFIRNGGLEEDELFMVDKNMIQYYNLYIITQLIFYIIIILLIIILVSLII
jgi:hypothetical protein